MIKKLEQNDLQVCAEIMMSVYNNEHWQCHWTLNTSMSYLQDYFDCKKFKDEDMGLSCLKLLRVM